MPLPQVFQRELQVAFSIKAQPVWFRIIKWVVFLGLAARFYRSPWFSRWVAGVAAAGMALHLVYRWKTHAWTRPWGGWDDLPQTQGTEQLSS